MVFGHAVPEGVDGVLRDVGGGRRGHRVSCLLRLQQLFVEGRLDREQQPHNTILKITLIFRYKHKRSTIFPLDVLSMLISQ